jgi:hypothetical protein
MSLTLGNPIIITGEMATSYKAQLAAAAPGGGVNNTSYGTLTTLKITKVLWHNPGAVGDTVTFGDPISGRTLLVLTCEVAGQSQIIDWTASPVLWSDFEMTQTGSGTGIIYVYNNNG